MTVYVTGHLLVHFNFCLHGGDANITHMILIHFYDVLLEFFLVAEWSC
jgi:hypothetical protein